MGAVVVTGAEETTAREPGLGPWDVRRGRRRGVERALPEWNQMQLSFVFPSPEENLLDPVSKLPPVHTRLPTRPKHALRLPTRGLIS